MRMRRSPPLPKKTKSRNTREVDWEPLKARIIELHIAQGLSLHEVRNILEDEIGFDATIRQYRSRISKWNLDKNVKSNEMRFIAQKQAQRKLEKPHKPPLRFCVRGLPVDSAKIERWKSRTGFDETEAVSPHDIPSTPLGLSYTTEDEEVSPPDSPPENQQKFSFITEDLSLESPHSAEPRMDWPGTTSDVSFNGGFDTRYLCGSLKIVTSDKSYPAELLLPEHSAEILEYTEFDAQKEDMLHQRLEELETRRRRNQLAGFKELEELGCLLLRQKRWKFAEEYTTSLLSTSRELYGNQHENTLWVMRLFGDAILGQGQWTKAEKIHREVYKFMEQTLGPDSPRTLSCLAALANNLSIQARHREASFLGLGLFESSSRLLGRSHPLTVVRAAKLAESYFHIGQCDKAEALFVQVLYAHTLGQFQPGLSSNICVD